MHKHKCATVALAFLMAMTLGAARLKAGYLDSFSGNTQAANTSGGDVSRNFAVLDRLSGASSPGDVFGTGLTGFDSLATIDTTARYLYVYQYQVSPASSQTFGSSDIFGDIGSITSHAQWILYFRDNNGVVSSSNPFGTDGVAFAPSAPANVGVISPSITASGTQFLHSVSFTISPTDFHVDYPFVLSPGSMSRMFGFTTNDAPVLSDAGTPSSVAVTGQGPIPSAIPEPSTMALLAVGMLGLLAARRRKTPGTKTL